MDNCLRILLECTVTMSLVALLLLAATPLLARRYSARCLYAAWMIVLLGFVIPFRPQPKAPPITVTVRAYETVRRQTPTQTPPTRSGAAYQNETRTDSASEPINPGEAAATPTQTPFWQNLDGPTAMVSAWAIGAALYLLVRLLAHGRFVRAVRRWSRPLQDENAISSLEALCRELGIRRRVALRLCPPVDSPMLTGLITPVILLPDANLPPRELALVLRHELCHLRRGDLWGRALLLAASAMQWFNPVLPVISRAVAFQCEAACDEAVMRHTDYETRVYYSHTILKIIRSRAGVATALSTRYNGGFKVMKKRISHILDKKAKRLGVAIVLAMAAAVLGVGMAFALTPEASQAPESTAPPAEMEILVPEPADTVIDYNEQMAESLTQRLRALIAQYGDELPGDDPFLDVYAIRPDSPGVPGSFTSMQTPWESIAETLDACQDAEALAEILRSSIVYVTSAAGSEALAGYTDDILAAAGYGDMPHRSYMRKNNWLVGSSEDAGLIPMWQVYAGGPSDPDAEDYQSVLLTITDEGKVHSLVISDAVTYEKDGYVTEAQQETAREAAVAFAREHVLMRSDACDLAVVSSRSYRGPVEPYTLVWIFDSADGGELAAPLPYNEEDHGENFGALVAVGLQSGKLLWVTACSSLENMFVVEHEAGDDWAKQTGKAFPYETDDFYVQNVIGARLGEALWELRLRYEDDLSGEQLQLATHMAAIWDNSWAYLSADGDWKRLLEDVEACETPEAFKAILRGSYLRINQSPAGEPSREEVLGAAEEMLDAIGYGAWTYRTFMYTDQGAQGAAQGYELRVGHPDSAASDFPVTIIVDGSGRLRAIEGPSAAYGRDDATAHRLTEAEKERLGDLAFRLVTEHMDMQGVEVDADDIVVGDLAYPYTEGEYHVWVRVPHKYTDAGGESQYDYEFTYTLDGRLRSMILVQG